ncbi:putative Chromatin remodeling factor mit1 [Glarea lozoyensis 74030]|uniref:Putative Chromatin remodeling factor mit1 n=1 Tax=Glarea lozoyensis (strain ATCC 74030 / MF5533) TaxID=1104152 RepID=H0EZ93_GLAL7|nr:putative Chromatin remodeling factor mit1 [Glarea lozoyensis 74030]
MVPPPARPWEYKPYRGDTTVDSVQAEVEGSNGEMEYKIEYEDGKKATVCLGYRSGREHMVTKVGHENFVMQCRRCIGITVKKDSSAPRLDVCQGCGEVGAACAAFSPRKTSKMEEKIREENGGDDPITEVAPDLLNNAEHVLFRCTRCHRGCHFGHLPALKKGKAPEDEDELRSLRRKEYGSRFQCKECIDHPDKPAGLVAWRLADREKYQPGDTYYDFTEDEKEYLVKWLDQSYFQCVWMPGSWVWGVTATVMRKAFANRDEGNNLTPKWTTEEAIPEEFFRMEIIFDVEYDSEFESGSEKSEKEQISLVDRVLVKFSGLGYDDAVWETPPSPEDKERWSCFVAAYNEFVVGVHFRNPPQSEMKKRVEAFHALDFAKKVEVKKQPASLVGGELMAYQKEGMNWMLYNYHKKKNVILADEMGLGKTIQVIALLATLITEKPKCWPFLVVTPNSTCPNWRREIKKWAPSLRVVTYYGGAKAREMAKNYELFPNGNSDLAAHVVVTSYEAPVNPECKAFFRKINWAGMIVDEGQRLKNDDNLLYDALKSLKTPFQCLLTGTPLQNNKRELFNLLGFLDQSLNAAKLDEKYEELTKDNLPELQDLIRPFFLRRTKLLVLKDLPTMAQVILPVSMSVVQKKLYKSILAKNPQLIKSIFGQRKTDLRPTERGNLNNILMQLRKCLCHPFIYSSAIEETSVSEEAMHRNLIDASSKFQLLELMLPKLRDRGHRVLLFSQFLNQLDLIEDFLKGLGFSFRRLDGNMGAQEKQKRIDEFNAPDSTVFAFLLSTRSGGVGINLATADTVIIMDPDFNPQQDIQAISRAHRIGQKNKVLVFQLMTKDSAEEKIIQIGRKKIALGALIETAGAEDDAGVDLESILKHGTKALFDDNDENDIRYDSASVDKLLDRAQVENTHTDDENSAESQFSMARVWAHDKGALEEEVGDADEDAEAPNFSVWDEILKTREAEAAQEAARNMQDFGRGKRARHVSTSAAQLEND